MAALHQYGSNNPLGCLATVDKVSFYPYFFFKDLVGWVVFALFFSWFIFFAPNTLGHPDNYIPANPMSTPAHIVPEWYFLPVYAILRSIPNKLAGVLAIGLVFVSLLLLPFLNTSPLRSATFRPLYKKLFGFLWRMLSSWAGLVASRLKTLMSSLASLLRCISFFISSSRFLFSVNLKLSCCKVLPVRRVCTVLSGWWVRTANPNFNKRFLICQLLLNLLDVNKNVD